MLYANRCRRTGNIEVTNVAGFLVATFANAPDGRLAYHCFRRGCGDTIPVDETAEVAGPFRSTAAAKA